MLSEALAQQIAAEISEVVDINVLITDATGTVIGSGDISRVGDFHEASVEVLRTGRMRTHGPEDVLGLIGSRPGLTVPLVVSGDVVGTVGLSGDPANVRQFGLIVRRQTEIMIREAERMDRRINAQRVVEDVVRDLFDISRTGSSALERRLYEVGIEARSENVVLVVRSGPARPATGATSGADDAVGLAKWLERLLPALAPDTVGAALSRDIAALIVPARPGALLDRPAAAIACEAVAENARSQHRTVRTAVGVVAAGVDALHASARDAYAALTLGERLHPERTVHHIDELRVEQMLAAVPHDSRERLAASLLGPLMGEHDWPALCLTLRVWGEHGFNVADTSRALGLHRNTVSYRLAKVERLSPAARGASATAVYLASLSASL